MAGQGRSSFVFNNIQASLAEFFPRVFSNLATRAIHFIFNDLGFSRFSSPTINPINFLHIVAAIGVTAH
jgi:hypothetical protein